MAHRPIVLVPHEWQNQRVRVCLRTLLIGLLLVELAPAGQAEPNPIVGNSPTAYVSPLTHAEQELQNFQTLQQWRDSGRISWTEYQERVMGLATRNKVVAVGEAIPSSPIEVSNPIPQAEAAPSQATASRRVPLDDSFAKAFLSSRPATSRSSTPVNITGSIQRPQGTLSQPKTKDVAHF